VFVFEEEANTIVFLLETTFGYFQRNNKVSRNYIKEVLKFSTIQINTWAWGSVVVKALRC
jgi:hypothetical protein